MGILLKASCIKCGFETRVSFGAGMLSFETECMVPALNKLNGIMVCENIYEKDHLGDNIIFYNDSKMHQGEIQNDAIEFGSISLNRKENFCPTCKTFSLNFIWCGIFD